MPSTKPTAPPIVPDEQTVPNNAVTDRLIVRVAGRDERDSLENLATRAGSRRPAGALMVGELDGRLLAAVSITNSEALSEPTPGGAVAAAVVRHRVAELGRRRRWRLKVGTPS
jgi:hypothetical protein